MNLNLTSFNEYESILREPYKNNFIDLNVGFFGLCSYQHVAWDHVLESVRKYYPDSPIVLFNDGGDQYDYSEMAKKYNCFHIKKDREICLHFPDIEASKDFLTRVFEACNIAKTEWMIHLHPDVICQGKICYHPNAHLAGVSAGATGGVSNNNWRAYYIDTNLWKVEKYIRDRHPNIELNGWGWCGGSIMHVESYYKVYDSIFGNNPTIDLLHLRDNTIDNVTCYDDNMMPVLFALNGFVYRIWKDNPEYHRQQREGAFLHGYKEHYNLIKDGMSYSEYVKKCHDENIEKSKKLGLS
jgi:hypothetical protein